MAPPVLALIGGTSLLEAPRFQQAQRQQVTTPFGVVTLLVRGSLLFLQRHGVDGYTPPHRLNHQAHLMALQQAGAQRILAIGSVGSLRREIPPGSLVVPDDFYAPAVTPSFFDDQRGHRPPGFHLPWRQRLLTALGDLAVAQGVYWQTTGPRFETPAEIRFHQNHCHVVGMTIAAECILAGELEIPYAALCMVDNYANGICEAELSYDSFRQQVRANQTTLLATLEPLLNTLLQEE